MKSKLAISCLLWFLCLSLSPAQEPALSPSTQKSVKEAMDRGVRFLRNSQNEQGHWGDPGITALALTAFFQCHRKYEPKDGPWVRQPLQYLLGCQKENGGIYQDHLRNYITCVSILALTSHPQVAEQHRDAIEKAKKFVLDLQCDEAEGYTPEEDWFYGGFGYGGSERPDLSNTQFALEALRSAGVPESDPGVQKAILFLQRCQNRSESNDLEWAGDDGGFVYYPGFSNAGNEDEERPRSYGSMTYAGIKSYIYAGITREDPRFQAAYEWIRRNYDLSENPGAGTQGLYYYYHTFAKTMSLLGDAHLIDDSGEKHNWREDLAAALLSRQNPDGSWANSQSRWWESDPRLATAYAVVSLSYCLE